MRRISFPLIAIIVIATTSLISQVQLEKVKELLAQKKSAEAIEMCQTFLQSNQRNKEGWLLLAKAQQQAGKPDAAESSAKKAIDLDDEWMEAYTLLAQIQLDKKNWRDAYNTAHAGLKMISPREPKYAPLLLELASSLLAGDSADAALIAASEAREINPNDPVAYDMIGKAYLKQNQPIMAVTNFKKSLEMDPQQINVLFSLAEAYTKGRQYTEAAETWNDILKRDSTNETAQLELAKLLYRAKQWPKCVKVMEDYLATHKNPSKEIKKMYIEALLKSGQYDKAYKEAQEIIKSEPNSSLAHRVYANYYFSKKQYTQAIDAFTKLKTVDTLDFDDLRLLGFSYSNVKKDSLAADTWEGIVKDTTQSLMTRSLTLELIGTAWMRLERFDRAADAFQRRMQIDPGSLAAKINYARNLVQMGRYDEALVIFKDAREKNPNFPPIYCDIGFVYFQKKDYEDARKEYETAIKVADTAEFKYRYDLADANRMIALTIMLRKETDPEASRKKWEAAIVYLKRSLKFKEDVEQTHSLLAKCYQNLGMIKEAIKEYERVLKLNPKNKEAKEQIENLKKFL